MTNIEVLKENLKELYARQNGGQDVEDLIWKLEEELKEALEEKSSLKDAH